MTLTTTTPPAPAITNTPLLTSAVVMLMAQVTADLPPITVTTVDLPYPREARPVRVTAHPDAYTEDGDIDTIRAWAAAHGASVHLGEAEENTGSSYWPAMSRRLDTTIALPGADLCIYTILRYNPAA